MITIKSLRLLQSPTDVSPERNAPSITITYCDMIAFVRPCTINNSVIINQLHFDLGAQLILSSCLSPIFVHPYSLTVQARLQKITQIIHGK